MFWPLLPHSFSQGMPSLSRSSLELPALYEATASAQLEKLEQFCACAAAAESRNTPRRLMWRRFLGAIAINQLPLS